MVRGKAVYLITHAENELQGGKKMRMMHVEHLRMRVIISKKLLCVYVLCVLV